jgi:predicted esterase
VFILLPLACHAQVAEPAPPLSPGSCFTVNFPQLPSTLAESMDPKGIPPMMSVFLPRNYDPQRQYPLFINLNPAAGGRGTGPAVARKITQEQDFVCVDVPLFKARVDPPTATNWGERMSIGDEDGKFAWAQYKIMLAKLTELVPNLDPTQGVLGGFSNGGHMTAALIDQSDGEVTSRFSAFFFVEGGGRMKRYDLLKGKPMLMMYGNAKSSGRIQEISDAATARGATVTVHEMPGVGHAFPEVQYPAVQEWLKGLGR